MHVSPVKKDTNVIIATMRYGVLASSSNSMEEKTIRQQNQEGAGLTLFALLASIWVLAEALFLMTDSVHQALWVASFSLC